MTHTSFTLDVAPSSTQFSLVDAASNAPLAIFRASVRIHYAMATGLRRMYDMRSGVREVTP